MTEFDHIRVVSERNTWPKLAQTHAHCDVEVTLERCVPDSPPQKLATPNTEH